MPTQDSGTELAIAVQDLAAEGDALFGLLVEMDTGYWTQVTNFKRWTTWDVVAHLHFSDFMALTSLRSADEFHNLIANIRHSSLAKYTTSWLAAGGHPPTGPQLLERWHATFLALCVELERADPIERFVWAGPGMKARMFATARQMETWAHGWEIYDLMNVERTHSDRLRNIVEIGVRTFGWAFENRGLEVPEEVPYVELISPSGAKWHWNDPEAAHSVIGSAVDFCQVVTQVRHVADTQLRVSGDNATAWMRIAQCFAGPPENPPPPGSRVLS